MVVVLVVPCPLALRVWWSWHGVDVCGRWWLTERQGFGAAVRWSWWALVGAVLLVCPGGLGVGWCGVAGPGPWSGGRALLAGALAGPLTCLGLFVWWVSGAGEPPCPRGGDGKRACQRCASRRRASRPLT